MLDFITITKITILIKVNLKAKKLFITLAGSCWLTFTTLFIHGSKWTTWKISASIFILVYVYTHTHLFSYCTSLRVRSKWKFLFFYLAISLCPESHSLFLTSLKINYFLQGSIILIVVAKSSSNSWS